MGLTLKLAWRNIFRNKLRSALTALAVVVAVSLSITMRSMQEATYDKNIESSAGIFTGFLQIQHEEFRDKPSLRKSFKLTRELKDSLEQSELITGYSERIYSFALVGKGDNSIGAALFGLDPKAEKNVSTLLDRVKIGEPLSEDRPYDLILGVKMLDKLNAKVGDTVVVLSSAYDGSMGNLKFKIGGAIKTGNPELDKSSIFITLRAAKELLYMGDKRSVAAISLRETDDVASAKEFLKKAISEDDQNLSVLDWAEISPDLKQGIEFDRVGGVILIAILIVVVGFGILNTLMMSVTERFREFGVMLAVGTKNATLTAIVFIETLILSLIGIGAGCVIAYFVTANFEKNPIYLGAEIEEMMAEYGFEPYMYATTDFSVFWPSMIIILAAALVAFVLPAIKLAKLEPLKGIRYT